MNGRWLFFAGYWSLLLAADQASKYLVIESDELAVFSGYAPLWRVLPDWWAFIASLISVVGLTIFLVSFVWRTERAGKENVGNGQAVSLSIITVLAGGVGNIMDIMARGAVTDFMVAGGAYFNLADIYVLTGGLGAVLCVFWAGRSFSFGSRAGARI